MTQEEKDLLLQDLCSRLPYGVKIELTNSWGYHHENIAKKGDITIDTLKGFSGKYFTINHDNPLDWSWADSEIEVEDIKPYLFPMSSMTGVEVLEYISLKESIIASDDITYSFETHESIDWLNKNKFDYRGLIPMGLAKDATGLGIY